MWLSCLPPTPGFKIKQLCIIVFILFVLSTGQTAEMFGKKHKASVIYLIQYVQDRVLKSFESTSVYDAKDAL